VGRRIRTLAENDLLHEALWAAEEIPDNLPDAPEVRAALGDFYRKLGCYAQAADAYGPAAGLDRSARRRRRRARMRVGRRTARRNRERKLLAGLRHQPRHVSYLGTIPGLDKGTVSRLGSEITTLRFRLERHKALMPAAVVWAIYLSPAAQLAVWTVLATLATQVGFVSGTPGIAAGSAISALVAFATTAIAFAVAFMRRMSLSWRRFFVLCGIVALTETAIGEAYARGTLPTAGWSAWLVYGLAVVPATMLAPLIIGVVISLLWEWRYKVLVRRHLRLDILDSLLLIIDGLNSPGRRRDLEQRRMWARLVGWVATDVERELAPRDFREKLASGQWLTRRAAGWAQALRHLQRQLVAPIAANEPKLRSVLLHEIHCLATGDLGALAWREPPPPPPRRVTLRRRAIDATRAITVALLPLSVVLAIQPVLHTGTGLFGWTRIATGAWALFYLIVSLDPTIAGKIDTARTLIGTIHDTRNIDTHDGSRPTRTQG
jgi:hypothetical protein